jgi:hypothetical protein
MINACILLYSLRRHRSVVIHKPINIVPEVITTQTPQNLFERCRIASLQRDQTRQEVVHLVNVGLLGIPLRVVSQHGGDVVNKVMQCVCE